MIVPAPVSYEPLSGRGTPRESAVTHRIDSALAPEAYSLEVRDGVALASSSTPAGAAYAETTWRQLVALTQGSEVDPVLVEDAPRFAYRGAMLDVARHFFGVADVCSYIDDLADLKINHLHLHLTDDQGWRLEIESWPELTRAGAATQVNGGGGGFYTAADYSEIVAYADSRGITVIPEIDLPGHTNAALVSYPHLADDGVELAPYEGIEVGFSSLAIGKEETYTFVADVLREVAALTPGPYLHIGGDECLQTPEADYLHCIARVTAMAAGLGKTVIGWHEMGRSRELPAGTIGQYWNLTTPEEAHGEHLIAFVKQGGQAILSPADVAYLDQKYDENTDLGLTWSGPTSLPTAYGWEPTQVIPGLGEDDILGLEAPMFTETVTTLDELRRLALPRLAAFAEIAWSPQPAAGTERDFASFAARLARLGREWRSRGITFEPVPEVEWEVEE